MKSITFKLELSHITDEMFLFIGEFQRLSSENKNFIIGFKEEGRNKVFVRTCKEFLENAYICIYDKDNLNLILSAINYAIALQAKPQISFQTDGLSIFLFIDFVSDLPSTLYKIRNFADSCGISYEMYP